MQVDSPKEAENLIVWDSQSIMGNTGRRWYMINALRLSIIMDDAV